MQQLREQAELERLREVELERSKWEAREERLVGQLCELQSKLKISEKSHVPGTSTGAPSSPGVTFGHVSQVNEPSSGLSSQAVQCGNEVQCDHTREVNSTC